jgi:CDP-glucose 4,6-dehydratase
VVWNPEVGSALRGRRALVTGHTGFKGAWLSLWLESLGTEVVGLSLPPEPGSLYERAGLSGRWPEFIADIRDFPSVEACVKSCAPEVVFHLAAQPIVSTSYDDPVGTFETNVMGTVHVMEAARQSPSVKGCVVVTTDKVYKPHDTPHRHVESDALGARDPYSASKAAAEHAVDAWRGLFSHDSGPELVAARAGNVIGGGDFAADRLLPDLIRAFIARDRCLVRHPDFTRPWQHVLDPLAGYLLVGARVLAGEPVPDAVNFGPDQEESVEVVADLTALYWGDGAAWTRDRANTMPETPLLALDSSLASRTLGWRPTWGTSAAISRTVGWWKANERGIHPIDLCLDDIRSFTSESDSG